MSDSSEMILNYNEEIEAVDRAIVAREKEIKDLICKRYELIAKKNDMEMLEVVECLYESNLEPKEIMNLIAVAINEKHSNS